ELRERIQAVAAQPGLGRPCPEVRPGYYRCAAGSHVVFYRRTDAGIEIVRILHGRMDFVRHL
ncbi:MAG TPA: type II toxin-antitoxin system RelE/ParE family toxin, partial [Acidisphaera sp.]|nr:type II toxin-antitoxin system RelE/ParE family toxin [Acidisphaera sp.]